MAEEQMDELPEELQKLTSTAGRNVFLQLLAFPVDARQLGDQAAVSRHADPPAGLKSRCAHAVLGDITCDSDGKVDHFIDRRGVSRTLRLHAVGTERYYLGAFLLGAYQEILGDLHNLFGDTNAVHVRISKSGEAVLETIIKGDTVSDVLAYVQFQDEELVSKLQTSVESAVAAESNRTGRSRTLLKFYEDGLRGYTYLS